MFDLWYFSLVKFHYNVGFSTQTNKASQLVHYSSHGLETRYWEVNFFFQEEVNVVAPTSRWHWPTGIRYSSHGLNNKQIVHYLGHSLFGGATTLTSSATLTSRIPTVFPISKENQLLWRSLHFTWFWLMVWMISALLAKIGKFCRSANISGSIPTGTDGIWGIPVFNFPIVRDMSRAVNEKRFC